MTGKTHLTAGLVTALALGVNIPQMALIAVGSMLPDIDHAGSTFGKMIKPLSRRLRHRGFTHSLLFLVLMTLISPYIGIGILTHIALDLLNPKGVELLYPCKKNLKVPLISKFIKTNGIIENIIFVGLIVGAVLMIIFYEDLWGYGDIMKFTTLWFPIK